MPVQMRLSPLDDRLYTPDRDLAYCSPHLVNRAMLGLDPGGQEPWIRDYLYDNEVDIEDLAEAAKVIANYMNTALTDPKHPNPFDALYEAGFFKLNTATQVIVCAKLGQVFLSAIFTSIRDVTRDPQQPHYDTKEIADIAKKFSDDIHNYRSIPAWRRWIYHGCRSIYRYFIG